MYLSISYKDRSCRLEHPFLCNSFCIKTTSTHRNLRLRIQMIEAKMGFIELANWSIFLQDSSNFPINRCNICPILLIW